EAAQETMPGADSKGGVRISNDSLPRVARGLLALLALALPFEAPLFRLGPLQITSVELVLYAMLAAGGLETASPFVRGAVPSRAAVATLGADAMVRAAVLWSIVIFI